MLFSLLHTERILLRKVEPSDAWFILDFFKNDEATKYMLYHFYNLDEVQEQMLYYKNQYENGTGCYWLMQHKQTNESLGVIGLHNFCKEHKKAELGFWILPKYNNKGYTTEAAKAVINFCFTQLQLNRIEATVETENIASIKVLEKLGFTHEGTFREFEMNNGRLIDLMMYSILKKEYSN